MYIITVETVFKEVSSDWGNVLYRGFVISKTSTLTNFGENKENICYIESL